jgi:NADH-quinone oxidoreductase subunit M
LPGMVNFVGEFLVLIGTWQVNIVTIVFGSAGLILGAVYGIWLCNRMLFGQIRSNSLQKFIDISIREFCILFPLIFLIFFMGIYPAIFLDTMIMSVNKYIVYI